MSHHSTVAATPLEGVFVTLTDSVRTFPRHWHGQFGLGVVERGAQRSASGRGAVEAAAGHCITHNPGEVHDGVPLGDAGRRWRMFHIEPVAMAGLLGVASAAALEWHWPVLHDEPLRLALQRAFEATSAQGGGVVPDLAARGLLEEALVLAVGRGFEQGLAARRPEVEGAHLDPVLARLADDMGHPPTLDELATLAGTSRFTLVRQFRRRHGLPPMAWLLQMRLQRARECIAAGGALADTALACGFSDQSHFTRLFTRQFGHTPGCWRRAVLGPVRRRATAF